MNKKTKICLLTSAVVLLAFIITIILLGVKIGRKQKEIDSLSSETYTVFYVDEDHVVERFSVKKGQSVNEVPAVPTHTGYFTRWSGDAENITSDTVIFCIKQIATVKVTGDYYVGETLKATDSAESSQKTNMTYIWLDGNNNELFRETTDAGYSEYTLTANEEGKNITVKLAKDGYFGNASYTSTAAVSSAKKVAVTVSISSYATTATVTLNDDAENAKDLAYVGGDIVGTFYAHEGDKIEVLLTNGSRPIYIYSYTTDEIPSTADEMTLEAGEQWVNVPSVTYTLKTDDNINGYFISITPEAT